MHNSGICSARALARDSASSSTISSASRSLYFVECICCPPYTIYPGPPRQPPFFLGYPARFEEYSCAVGFLIYRPPICWQEHNAVSMASGILRGGCPALERDGLTSSSSSRLFQTRRLRKRRGALFLIHFLSNLAILLGVLPSRAGVHQRLNHKHCSGPSFLRPAA